MVNKLSSISSIKHHALPGPSMCVWHYIVHPTTWCALAGVRIAPTWYKRWICWKLRNLSHKLKLGILIWKKARATNSNHMIGTLYIWIGIIFVMAYYRIMDYPNMDLFSGWSELDFISNFVSIWFSQICHLFLIPWFTQLYQIQNCKQIL